MQDMMRKNFVTVLLSLPNITQRIITPTALSWKKKLFVVVKGKKAIMRTPKQYCSRNSLTCPYHQLMYKIDCTQKIALKSNSLIHPTLGKLRTNATESCFNTLLTRFRNKSNHLKCMHYEVCTNLGLIHSNMTRLINSDEKYHWFVCRT